MKSWFRAALACLAPLLSSCYLIGGPSDAGGSRTAVLSIPAGVMDTMVVAGGSALEIDNRAGDADLEVTLEETGRTEPLSGARPHELIIRATPRTSTIAAQHLSGRPPVVIPARAFLAGLTSVLSGQSRIGVGHPETPGTTYFWTEGMASHFVDPLTGEVRAVEVVDMVIPTADPSALILAIFDADTGCESKLVDLDPGAPAGSVPVVFVHGWQPSQSDFSGCGWTQEWFASLEPFEDLIPQLGTVVGGQSIHRYAFRYDSREPIRQNGAVLLTALKGATDRPAVIVAHSMGGLVARGMLTFSQTPEIRALITLGTPHSGTPLARPLALDDGESHREASEAIEQCVPGRGSWVLPITLFLWDASEGVRDMSPGSELLETLAAGHPYRDRLFSIAGVDPGTFSDPWLARGECIIRRLGVGAPSDGVVPLASAAPDWSAGQRTLAGFDHLELPHTQEVATIIRDALLRFVDCEVVTPPTAPNAFPISGSVRRISPTEVAVTLNAVLIDGVLQPPLSADQVRVVENGCTIPQADVTVMPQTTPRGVDIAFVQDLSSSMRDVIAGVRNSVQTFAQALTVSGIDIRLAAVGYSGPGTIPTSPPASPEEFLGPVRDFATADLFAQHISQEWVAYDGGDKPENGLEAIEYAMQDLSWRPGAARVILDITDVGHHSASTSCNGRGPCTNHTLASILSLLGGQAVVHSIAPASLAERTWAGSLDPWLLAAGTGGKQIPLGSGYLDLMSLGLVDVLASSTTFTFRSASTTPVPENLRIIVTIDGRSGEFRPGLVTYLRN